MIAEPRISLQILRRSARNVNGTCEITLVCLPFCSASPRYNIRAHVIPGRWLTLHVMNAGGKALEWYRSVFCSEMSEEDFYTHFLEKAIDAWIDRAVVADVFIYIDNARPAA